MCRLREPDLQLLTVHQSVSTHRSEFAVRSFPTEPESVVISTGMTVDQRQGSELARSLGPWPRVHDKQNLL